MANIVEEFQSMAASMGALLEGVGYIDEDVAEKLAVEFTDKLVAASREVYAEMASKIAEELRKPTKKRRRRRRVATAVVPVHPEETRTVRREGIYYNEPEAIGNAELPENPLSFIGGDGRPPSGPISGMEDMGDQLGSPEIVERGPYVPPTRRQGAPTRLTQEEIDEGQRRGTAR